MCITLNNNDFETEGVVDKLILSLPCSGKSFGVRIVMALLQHRGEPLLTTTNVFQEGDINWKQHKVETSSTNSSPPKPLIIFTPTVPGTYPVILFCHGFCIRNTFYSKLLGHIASHGFIIVAPQLFCNGMPMLGYKEVECAGKVVDWIACELQPLLPEKVKATLDSLVLAGHSRGGKTAFAVALGYAKTTKLKFSVLIGIDPVAGTSKCKICRTCPHILTWVPRSFNLTIPTAVIGTGLGPEKSNILSIPCAPEGVNHKEFFNECKPPCAHFVARDYGHMDMLDDDTPGVVGEIISKCMCKNGKGPRDLMRKTVGGLVVAFLKAHLEGKPEDMDAILKDTSIAPAKLVDVEYLRA